MTERGMSIHKTNTSKFQVSRFTFQVNLKRETWNVKLAQAGQSTLEYAVVIAVVAAALLGMQVYMRSGVAGRLRTATDQVGDQFSPTAYKSRIRTDQKSATEDTLHVAGATPAESQASGESKSKTITLGSGATAVTNIFTKRTSEVLPNAGGGGVEEQMTDAQSTEGTAAGGGSLF